MFCSAMLIVHLLLGASLGMTKKNGSAVIVHSGGKADGKERDTFRGSPEQFEGCPSKVLTDSERRAVLFHHNIRRLRLASGLEKIATGRAPQASQMYQLAYDCQLENSSQERADNCAYTSLSNEGMIGENIYTTKAKRLSNRDKIIRAVVSWWSEIKKTEDVTRYEVADGNGHFAQMAWDATIKVGCGISSGCKDVHVVCHYLPRGSVHFAIIYAVGSPCSTDEDCMYYEGSYCKFERSLCIIRDAPVTPGPAQNGAANYLHGWLGLFHGKMTRAGLLTGTAYFVVVSGLLAITEVIAKESDSLMFVSSLVSTYRRAD